MNSLGVAVTGVAFAGAGVFLLSEAATAAGVACLIIGGMGLIGAIAMRLRNGEDSDSRRGIGFAVVLLVLGLGLGLILLIAAPAAGRPVPRGPDDPAGVRILGGLISAFCVAGLVGAIRWLRKSGGG